MKKVFSSSILAIILLSSVFTMNSVFGADSTKKTEAKKTDDKKKVPDAKKAEKIKLAKERYTAKKAEAKKMSKKKTLEDKKSEPIQIDREITHDVLVQYALKKINQDRQKYNLSPVLLSSNTAAQTHAEDVLKTRIISHWMSNGEKPYMTYTNAGGTGSVSQNIAVSSCSGFGCSMNPIKEIESLEFSMMYDDASSDWGHRDNILQPYHTHVSIGISYDGDFFTMVQNFEDNILLSKNPITITGGDVQIHSNLKKGLPITVAIFYDPLPTSELYSQHFKDHYYKMGDLVAVVQRPAPVNYYYDQPSGYKLIEATTWATTDTFVSINFDVSPVITKPGVYTVGVNMNVDGRNPWITNYSKIYKLAQLDELQTQMSEKEQKIADEKYLQDITLKIHELINDERRYHTMKPLEWNLKLAQASFNHSIDMASRGYFKHDSPEGHDFTWRYSQVDFNCILKVNTMIGGGGKENIMSGGGENIMHLEWIQGVNAIATETVNGWMDSPEHRAKILTPYFQSEGIGVATSDSDIYITQDFC